MNPLLSIETLWRAANFTPNPEQAAAILHLDGPLYLPAGPGSGKTRVLLWRTLNLIVFHDISPDEIFLSTFTGTPEPGLAKFQAHEWSDVCQGVEVMTDTAY